MADDADIAPARPARLLRMSAPVLCFAFLFGAVALFQRWHDAGPDPVPRSADAYAGETILLRRPADATAVGAQAVQPAQLASVSAQPVTIGQTSASALEPFYAALAEMETGRRTKPVTVLHLGDGHIAGDRLDAHMRALLQARFGDAGRGGLLPPAAIKGYRARGLRFDVGGSWSSLSALDGKAGILGLSGVQASASSAEAQMVVTSLEAPFEAAEVAFLAGPDRGAATVAVDGRSYAIVTRAAETGVQRVRITLGGQALSVRPAGTGPVTVLSWSLVKNRAGIRYVAFGLAGGGIAALERADDLVLADDIRALRPELIVLGYGAGEANDDRLDIGRYAERLAAQIERLKRLAPEAALLIVGPPDANRVPEFAGRQLRGSPTAGCRALSPQERAEYATLLSEHDDRLARWHPPPNLDDVRLVLQRAALAHGAYYWDWSRLMGGACGIHAWVHAKPELATADHVTLTDEGYQRSAKALFSELIQGYSARRQLVGQPR